MPAADTPAREARFVEDILSNRVNRCILERWQELALPGGWLVAGCLFQTVWNRHAGLPPEHGIQDYDIFYFDATDLSAQREAQVQQRVDRALGFLGVPIEVKNQARVHLWYESYFGFPYPRLASAKEGIDRFLIPSTCVGVRPAAHGYDVYAPHGLDMLFAGVLAPNPLTPHLELFRRKAASYKARWAWLEVREPA